MLGLDWKAQSKAHSGETSLMGEPAKFHRGLYQIGDGVWAWMQPNGSWGESNAGIIASEGESLVFDSLFDLRLTQRMLEEMAPIFKDAPVRTLVNSHSNGDHTYGNQLFGDAEILASERCAHEMPNEPPSAAAILPTMGKVISCCGLGGAALWPLRNMYRVGRYFTALSAPFDFRGIDLTLPTKTFNGEYEGMVGRIPYRLIEVGPAHTDGDILLYLPEQKILFGGDILFIDGTPAAWNPGVTSWLGVLETIQNMDVEYVVPGHGPIVDKAGIDDLKSYFEIVLPKTEDLYRNGMQPNEIAKHLLLDDKDCAPFKLWDSPERMVMTTNTYTRVLGQNMTHYSNGERLKVLWATASLAFELPEACPKVMHTLA